MTRKQLGISAVAIVFASAMALAQDPPKAPTAPAPSGSADDEEDVVVDVTTAVAQLPQVIVSPATEGDRALTDEVRAEIERTGLYDCPAIPGLRTGMPEPSKWPPLAQAGVIVARVSPTDGSFPSVRLSTVLKTNKDEAKRRELVEYPGSSALVVPTLVDAAIEDITGVRSHMSGRVVITDASIRGERSVRVVGPSGRGDRRINGPGSLARGADFGEGGMVFFASEDRGKLALFKEGQAQPIPLSVPGYVQGVSFSPNGKRVALSMGQGSIVQTYVGTSFRDLKLMPTEPGMTALSPAINDAGEVVQAIGPATGAVGVFVDGKRITPPGVWASSPSFCATATEKRVVYTVRSGNHWDVRITSVASGATRTVMLNAVAPSCSPDGRTVYVFAPRKSAKSGAYLVSDQGGTPHKVAAHQAAGSRWRAGEPLPARTVERITPQAAPPAKP